MHKLACKRLAAGAIAAGVVTKEQSSRASERTVCMTSWSLRKKVAGVSGQFQQLACLELCWRAMLVAEPGIFIDYAPYFHVGVGAALN